MEINENAIPGTIGSEPCCAACGSTRVVRGAWVCWNSAAGLWELETVLDGAFCHACGDGATLTWRLQAEPPNSRIRELNDRFRTHGQGRGSIMVTSGIQEKGAEFVLAAVEAVRAFDNFSQDNDPWGEHDFGAVELEGEKVFFKFDYYDLALRQGSENPANEGCTHRVLTIMLANEY